MRWGWSVAVLCALFASFVFSGLAADAGCAQFFLKKLCTTGKGFRAV